jgi:DNA-binding CsgD family transcriptional regulator
MSNHVTPRELQIAELISFGKTEKEIGNFLDLSVDTIKSHKRSLFTKTCSRNIADVTRWYFTHKSGVSITPSFGVRVAVFSVIGLLMAAIFILKPESQNKVLSLLSSLSTSLQNIIK